MKAQRFDRDGHNADLRVLLITESTYPFHFSGVTSWCRNLVGGLPTVDFHILALVANPDLAPLFELPANVSAVTTVPIWGVREALETRNSLRLADLRRARRAPDDQTLVDGLGRPLRELVSALFSVSADPSALAQQVNALYEFFLIHDFDTSMHSAVAWEAFVASAQESFPVAAHAAGYSDAPLGVSDAVTGLHWLYHWLLTLSQPLPEADVTHATMAGEAILPAVASKLHHGAGLVFSEHGVYLREVYLREAAEDGSLFLKLLKIGFARRTTEMAYAEAEQISTCCDYNKRWVLRHGGSPERVQTIHYGLDGIGPDDTNAPSDRAPVILWLGRIHPLKDIETLLRAASIVHRVRADAVFRLHGSASADQNGYGERLLALRSELGLDGVVELPGYTSDPQGACDEADIVVLTSISEGFPYSTLEAMRSGKPVVATAVGGVPEQLGDCGVLVEPRSPDELAAALIDLIDDPSARARMGDRARERVREMFSLEQKNRLHLEAYVAAAGDGARPIDGSEPHAAQRDEVVAPSGAAKGALIDAVSAQVRHPVDEDEIAAVLEANGITDAVAHARYDAGDAFELAAAIFPSVRGGNGGAALQRHRTEPPDPQRRSIPHAADGVLMLIPPAVLLSAGLWVRSIHGWTSGTSRALLWGVAVSTLLGNAFLFAIMRRGALLIGCDRWGATRKFLRRWSSGALIALLCADLVAMFVAHTTGTLSTAGTATFGLSFAALIGLWILSGGLFLLRRAYEVGLATLAGVAVGAAAYYASGAGSAAHLEIALGAGYFATVAIVVARVGVLVGQRPRGRDAPRLPRLVYLLSEAAPFAAYGGLVIILVLGPNLVTAVRAISAGSSESRSVALGMTLALVPLLLSIPAAESALLAVSDRISAVLSETDVSQPEPIVSGLLHDFHRRQSARYLTRLALLSLVAVPVLWLLADAGVLGGLGVHSTGTLLLALVISLVSYLLLARAQFDLMPAITLARADLALRCLIAGLGVTAFVAAVTFALGFAQAGPTTLLAGTCTFAVLAAGTSGRFFARLALRVLDAM